MGRRRRRRKSRPSQAAKAAVVKKRGATQQKQQAVKQQQKAVDTQKGPTANVPGLINAPVPQPKMMRNGQAVAEKRAREKKGSSMPVPKPGTGIAPPKPAGPRPDIGGRGAIKGGQRGLPRPGRGRGKGGQRPVDQGSGGREFGGGFRNRGFGMGRGERGYGMGRGRGGMAGGDMPDFMGGQKPQMFQDRVRGERATFGMGREGRGFGMGREGSGGMISSGGGGRISAGYMGQVGPDDRPLPVQDRGGTQPPPRPGRPSRWGGEGPPPPNARGGGRPAAPTSGYNPATGRMEYTGGSPGNFSSRNQGRGGGFASRRARAFPRAGAIRDMAPRGMVKKSDIRAKENIERIGISPSGIPIYEFNYIGDNNRYSGAMAQDLLKINPDVVSMGTDGYYMIDYNNIDVDMHLIN